MCESQTWNARNQSRAPAHLAEHRRNVSAAVLLEISLLCGKKWTPHEALLFGYFTFSLTCFDANRWTQTHHWISALMLYWTFAGEDFYQHPWHARTTFPTPVRAEWELWSWPFFFPKPPLSTTVCHSLKGLDSTFTFCMYVENWQSFSMWINLK